MQKENNLKFCAVNSSDIILFNNEKLPQIVSLNKIIDTFNVSKNVEISLKNGLLFQEYIFTDPVYIHSINKVTSKISLNKIRSIIYYKNLNNMYRIKPYLLNSFTVTQKNSLLDPDFNQIDLQISNINSNNLIKHNKFYGKKIGTVNGIELTTELGYLMGQWYSRGYIDKSKRGNNFFTWVCIDDVNSQKVLKIISHSFNCTTLHIAKKDEEKFEYVQIIDNNVNEILNDGFISNKSINDWIFSSSYSFINGLIYGIFFTNNTISFNKERSKAYVTIKFLNHSLAEKFTDLLNLRYNVSGTLSLVPDKKFCKVSYRLNKSFFKIIENGFTYGYIANPFKETLLQEVKDVIKLDDYDNGDFSQHQFKLEKTSLSEGYNFRINGARGFSLLNGVLVPSL